jgi:hypothetical protein
VHSKIGNEKNKLFKLKGTLSDSADWALIFSKIRNLKDTDLYFDKCHSPEVTKVLGEFRKKVFVERQQNKNAFLKNLTLTIDDNNFDVYNVIKSRFLKSI